MVLRSPSEPPTRVAPIPAAAAASPPPPSGAVLSEHVPRTSHPSSDQSSPTLSPSSLGLSRRHTRNFSRPYSPASPTESSSSPLAVSTPSLGTSPLRTSLVGGCGGAGGPSTTSGLSLPSTPTTDPGTILHHLQADLDRRRSSSLLDPAPKRRSATSSRTASPGPPPSGPLPAPPPIRNRPRVGTLPDRAPAPPATALPSLPTITTLRSSTALRSPNVLGARGTAEGEVEDNAKVKPPATPKPARIQSLLSALESEMADWRHLDRSPSTSSSRTETNGALSPTVHQPASDSVPAKAVRSSVYNHDLDLSVVPETEHEASSPLTPSEPVLTPEPLTPRALAGSTEPPTNASLGIRPPPIVVEPTLTAPSHPANWHEAESSSDRPTPLAEHLSTYYDQRSLAPRFEPQRPAPQPQQPQKERHFLSPRMRLRVPRMASTGTSTDDRKAVRSSGSITTNALARFKFKGKWGATSAGSTTTTAPQAPSSNVVLPWESDQVSSSVTGQGQGEGEEEVGDGEEKQHVDAYEYYDFSPDLPPFAQGLRPRDLTGTGTWASLVARAGLHAMHAQYDHGSPTAAAAARMSSVSFGSSTVPDRPGSTMSGATTGTENQLSMRAIAQAARQNQLQAEQDKQQQQELLAQLHLSPADLEQHVRMHLGLTSDRPASIASGTASRTSVSSVGRNERLYAPPQVLRASFDGGPGDPVGVSGDEYIPFVPSHLHHHHHQQQQPHQPKQYVEVSLQTSPRPSPPPTPQPPIQSEDVTPTKAAVYRSAITKARKRGTKDTITPSHLDPSDSNSDSDSELDVGADLSELAERSGVFDVPAHTPTAQRRSFSPVVQPRNSEVQSNARQSYLPALQRAGIFEPDSNSDADLDDDDDDDDDLLTDDPLFKQQIADASAHLADLDEWDDDDARTSVLPTLNSAQASKSSNTDRCTVPQHVPVGVVAQPQPNGKPAGQHDRNEPRDNSSSPDLGPLVRSFPPVPTTTISTDSSSPTSNDGDRIMIRKASNSSFTRSRTCSPWLDSDGLEQSESAQSTERTEQPEQVEQAHAEKKEEYGPLPGPDPSSASPVPHSSHAKPSSVLRPHQPSGLGLQPPRSIPHLGYCSTSSPAPSGLPLPSSLAPSSAQPLAAPHRTAESRLPIKGIKGLRTLPKPRPSGLATPQTALPAPSSTPAQSTGSSLPRLKATSTSASVTKDPLRHTTSSLPRPSVTRGTLARSSDSNLRRPDHLPSLPRPTTKGGSGTRSLPRPSKAGGLPLPTCK